jgi:beta-lactam-binding protein with PASTA domain
MGGLIDIAGTGTTTALHVPVPAPQTLITVPNLSGRDLKTVATDIARLGLIASSCSGTPPSGTVTGQSPGAGTNVLAGSVVKYFYNGCAPF